MSRVNTDKEYIEKLKKDKHDIKDDGSGIYEGVEFRDFYDKTANQRYRVYFGDFVPAPPEQHTKIEIVPA